MKHSGTSEKPMRILIADDHALVRQGLQLILAGALKQAEFGETADSRQTLEAVLKHPWDLVILDLSMPVMDGWQAAARLRSAHITENIPIIAFTAHAMAGDEKKAIDAGCNDYLTKPFDPGELVARVRAVLRRKQSLGPVTDFESNGFKISADRRQVWLGGSAVAMTPKEFDLLLMMVSKRGAVITREEIGQLAHIADMSEKEARQYSYARAILGSANEKQGIGKFDGLEQEVDQDLRKQWQLWDNGDAAARKAAQTAAAIPTPLPPATAAAASEVPAAADFFGPTK